MTFFATRDISESNLRVKKGGVLPERFQTKWVVSTIRKFLGADAIAEIKPGDRQYIIIETARLEELEAIEAKCAPDAEHGMGWRPEAEPEQSTRKAKDKAASAAGG